MSKPDLALFTCLVATVLLAGAWFIIQIVLGLLR